jgi:hypothetical protein
MNEIGKLTFYETIIFWWCETLEWTVEEIGPEREPVEADRKLIEIFSKKNQATIV